jgi:Branched-chain amino acid aminotransferase/4-amino-4-deoxychorismate lyase
VFDHGLSLWRWNFRRAYVFTNGRVFAWNNTWSAFGIQRVRFVSNSHDPQEMTEALLETIRQNQLRDGYIRLVVTRGVGNLGLNPEQCKNPSVIIIVATIALYHEDFYRKGLSIVTVATRRSNPASLNPAVKSLNYLNNVMARIEANLASADEALMLNDAGNVAECTADNVFIIKHGQIFTPPITAGALQGITRSVVFDIAGEFGIKVIEADFTRHDIFVPTNASSRELLPRSFQWLKPMAALSETENPARSQRASSHGSAK